MMFKNSLLSLALLWAEKSSERRFFHYERRPSTLGVVRDEEDSMVFIKSLSSALIVFKNVLKITLMMF